MNKNKSSCCFTGYWFPTTSFLSLLLVGVTISSLMRLDIRQNTLGTGACKSGYVKRGARYYYNGQGGIFHWENVFHTAGTPNLKSLFDFDGLKHNEEFNVMLIALSLDFMTDQLLNISTPACREWRLCGILPSQELFRQRVGDWFVARG